jgi:hypothetical protein
MRTAVLALALVHGAAAAGPLHAADADPAGNAQEPTIQVPEPSSLVLAFLGVLTMLGCACLRRGTKTAATFRRGAVFEVRDIDGLSACQNRRVVNEPWGPRPSVN